MATVENVFDIEGMTCASCVATVEKAARKVAGVQATRVNLARGRAVVEFDPASTSSADVAKAITDSGYPAKPEDSTVTAVVAEETRLHHQRHEARAWRNRAIAGVVLWLPVEATHWIRHLSMGQMNPQMQMGVDWMIWLSLITSTIAIIYVGAAFYRSAWRALLRGTTNMDTLIAMGASVAYVYSLIALIGNLSRGWPLADLYFMEATGLLALISLGHWMEARARDSAGSAIRELMNLAPATAWRFENNDYHEVPVGDLRVGDILKVRPGDRIPIDGVITTGQASIDESMISGEPLPVMHGVGDSVIGGTQNIDLGFQMRVSRIGSETALAEIVRLVEHAQSSKPAVQKLADQIAAVFVPCVLIIAVITAVGWYAWGQSHHWETAHTWAMLAKAVCSVLIIACPCALGLAVPAALMVGMGMGAKRGILIRDIDALQTAEKIDTVVLDKTGTITQGKPGVASITPANGVTDNELLRLAASAEQYSEHPLAKAIVMEAQKRMLPLLEPSSFKNEPGMGVIAEVDHRTLLVGSVDLMLKDVKPKSTPAIGNSTFKSYATPELVDHIIGDLKQEAEQPGTSVFIRVKHADDRIEYLGSIRLVDQVKTDAKAAIQELHSMKLKTILLSGDQFFTAKMIAEQVGIQDVRAGVKPAGKADVIRELQSNSSRIAMVGDGINDAPALAQADLGIAIGSGSDIAKETGDIVLTGGSLHGIAVAIRLSRATMRAIRQNLLLAVIYNVCAIPLAAMGMLNPLIAAAAMALSDVTVIGNALRLRRSRID